MKLIKKLLSVFLVISSFLSSSSFVKAHEFILCEGFTSEILPPEIKDLVNCNSSINDDRNDFIKIDDLRYLKIKYWGFDQKEHNDGEMLVNKDIAKEVLEIFKKLYDNQFPIKQIKLVEHYNSIDEDSMFDNNTSAFRLADCSLKSKKPWHALGFAIDINPMMNPCIYPNSSEPNPKFVPHNAENFLDRSEIKPGMITNESNNTCYKAFTEKGWEWGGNWDDPIDLHHFQKYTWTTEFTRAYKTSEGKDEETKYKNAVKDEQGREALIALGKIPQKNDIKRLAALSAVIDSFESYDAAK